MKLGVAVLLESPIGYPLLKRKGTDLAPGTWCMPGGHVEDGEDPATTAAREVMEETGCRVTNVAPANIFTIEDHGELGKYITFYYIASTEDHPTIAERDKASDIWFSPSLINTWLPDPLFPGTMEFLQIMKKLSGSH